MEILIKAAQLLMSLSILVVLHELGHFIPAKLFKTKVEKFYLFFDPWFSVVKKKIGDTEYGIGWLPLGGYVKISGMIDESMDKEQMEKPAEPWEFRSKPAWQRLIIMLGGVTVNLLLGMFIYSMTLYFYGDKYLPNENLSDEPHYLSVKNKLDQLLENFFKTYSDSKADLWNGGKSLQNSTRKALWKNAWGDDWEPVYQYKSDVKKTLE